MGYRSQVSYVVRFSTHETRDEYVALILAKNDPHLTKALGQCYVPSPIEQLDDPIIYFSVSDWKWYSDYPEVKAHTTIYEWAHELYPEDCDYRFIRVGENADDIEEESSGGVYDEYDDVYPVTVIESRYPAEYTPFNP